MAETQIFYLGTSKVKEIRIDASVTFDWGAYGKWTKFKSPKAASSKKVKYDKTSKDKAGGSSGAKTPPNDLVLGTRIPKTAERTISGVSRTVDVRYFVRGYVFYSRTAALKKDGKMKKTNYTKSDPYQYRLQYKDKPVKNTAYSKYVNGKEYVYFDDHYYNDQGESVATDGHIPHPVTCNLTYSDIRRNFDTSNANNSDNRDNKGTYVAQNVRTNVMSIALSWEGLNTEQGTALMNILNPQKDTEGNFPYIIGQVRDLETDKIVNKTFIADTREVNKLPNGYYDTISVTLVEV